MIGEHLGISGPDVLSPTSSRPRLGRRLRRRLGGRFTELVRTSHGVGLSVNRLLAMADDHNQSADSPSEKPPYGVQRIRNVPPPPPWIAQVVDSFRVEESTDTGGPFAILGIPPAKNRLCSQ